MRLRLDLPCLNPIFYRQGRQQDLAIREDRLGIVAPLHVGPEEASEHERVAASPELDTAPPYGGRYPEAQRLGHLGGNRALPNQLVQGGVDRLET